MDDSVAPGRTRWDGTQWDRPVDDSLIFRPAPITDMLTGEPMGPPWKGTMQVVELATGRYWAAWTDAGDRIEKEGKAFAVQVFVQVNTAAEYLPVRMFDGTFIEIRQWIRDVRTQEQLHRPSVPTRVSRRPR